MVVVSVCGGVILQVFIPTVPIAYTPSHHVDILCTLGPMPSAEDWERKGLDKYGLIAVNTTNEAAQVIETGGRGGRSDIWPIAVNTVV